MTALGLLGAIGAGVFFVEDRYAKTWHVVQVEQRLDYKIKSDQLAATQQRLWTLEDRYGSKCVKAEKEVRQVCADLEQSMERLRGELKALENRRP